MTRRRDFDDDATGHQSDVQKANLPVTRHKMTNEKKTGLGAEAIRPICLVALDYNTTHCI